MGVKNYPANGGGATRWNFWPPPFETPKTLFSLTEQETKKWLKRLRKLSHLRRVTAMRTLYSQHGVDLSRPADVFKDMRRRLSLVGLFSLSENCDSELMWAHYGANHQGIAIGFNRTRQCKLADPRHTFPVTYSENKPTFAGGFKNELQLFAPGSGTPNRIRISFEDDVFRSTISTKTPAWLYEREWRYVEETSGLFAAPAQITRIVFGLRMELDRRKHYRNLANRFIENEISFFEVTERTSLSGFEIKRA